MATDIAPRKSKRNPSYFINFFNIEKLRSYLANLSVNYGIPYITLCFVFQIVVSVVLGISSPLGGSYIITYNCWVR